MLSDVLFLLRAGGGVCELVSGVSGHQFFTNYGLVGDVGEGVGCREAGGCFLPGLCPALCPARSPLGVGAHGGGVGAGAGGSG